MLYTIKNNDLTVTFNDRGAELWSIVHRGAEYVWQGDDAYWGDRAYNIFPVCGRLVEGRYTHKGKSYTMDIHGFSRTSTYTCVEQTDSRIAFRLEANDETRALYPFDFALTLTYTLEGKTLRTAFTVENRGGETMPFAVGSHPGFNVQIDDTVAFEDWRLEFGCVKEDVRQFVITDDGFIPRENTTFPFTGMADGKTIHLRRDLFDRDAIFLEQMCKKVTLCSDKCDRSVTVEYPDMQYLGIWQPDHSDAPFVCIEPWYSMPSYDGEVDDLATKRDMIPLAPGAVYTNSFTITVA